MTPNKLPPLPERDTQTMQSADGKTWVPAVPVSPRSVGCFGLHYRVMFRIRALIAALKKRGGNRG